MGQGRNQAYRFSGIQQGAAALGAGLGSLLGGGGDRELRREEQRLKMQELKDFALGQEREMAVPDEFRIYGDRFAQAAAPFEESILRARSIASDGTPKTEGKRMTALQNAYQVGAQLIGKLGEMTEEFDAEFDLRGSPPLAEKVGKMNGKFLQRLNSIVAEIQTIVETGQKEKELQIRESELEERIAGRKAQVGVAGAELEERRLGRETEEQLQEGLIREDRMKRPAYQNWMGTGEAPKVDTPDYRALVNEVKSAGGGSESQTIADNLMQQFGPQGFSDAVYDMRKVKLAGEAGTVPVDTLSPSLREKVTRRPVGTGTSYHGNRNMGHNLGEALKSGVKAMAWFNPMPMGDENIAVAVVDFAQQVAEGFAGEELFDGETGLREKLGAGEAAETLAPINATHQKQWGDFLKKASDQQFPSIEAVMQAAETMLSQSNDALRTTTPEGKDLSRLEREGAPEEVTSARDKFGAMVDKKKQEVEANREDIEKITEEERESIAASQAASQLTQRPPRGPTAGLDMSPTPQRFGGEVNFEPTPLELPETNLEPTEFREEARAEAQSIHDAIVEKLIQGGMGEQQARGIDLQKILDSDDIPEGWTEETLMELDAATLMALLAT